VYIRYEIKADKGHKQKQKENLLRILLSYVYICVKKKKLIIHLLFARKPITANKFLNKS